MAITFVGSMTGTNTASTATNLPVSGLKNSAGATPTLLQNDIVVVAVAISDSVNHTLADCTPTGYTAINASVLNAASNYNISFAAFYKRMGATPDTVVSMPGAPGSAEYVAVAVEVFRGVDTTTAIDVTATTATNAAQTFPKPPAITPVTAGAWIVGCGGTAAATAQTYTGAPGYTATTNYFVATSDTFVEVGSAIFSTWSSGAYTPSQFTGGTATSASDAWAAISLALRPAGSGGSDGTANGAATASAVGKALTNAVGTANGSSTASGVGKALAASSGPSNGTSTAAATGASLAAAAGTANGTSTAAATSAALRAATGTADGLSTASGVGAATSGAAGTANGAATASAVGAANNAAVGTVNGTSTASGAGSLLAAATGTANGAATVAGASASSSTASGTGTANGVSTTSGVGKALANATGAAAGTGSASGVGAFQSGSFGTASGQGGASAVALNSGVGGGAVGATVSVIWLN